jgi:hypothetical protein
MVVLPVGTVGSTCTVMELSFGTACIMAWPAGSVARRLGNSMRLIQWQPAAHRERPADGAGARVSRVLLEPCLSLATEPSEIQCADALRRLAPHLLMR